MPDYTIDCCISLGNAPLELFVGYGFHLRTNFITVSTTSSNTGLGNAIGSQPMILTVMLSTLNIGCLPNKMTGYFCVQRNSRQCWASPPTTASQHRPVWRILVIAVQQYLEGHKLMINRDFVLFCFEDTISL